MGALLVEPNMSEAGHIEHGSREFMAMVSQDRHPSVRSIMKHFAWSHLPVNLQAISRAHADHALQMCGMIKDSAELATGLRKLLESKDCMVRAALEE